MKKDPFPEPQFKKVSYSKVTSYLSCPYKHYLGYVKRLKQKKPVRPLTFGGDFHKLLENRGNKMGLKAAVKKIKTAYDDLTPRFREEIGPDYITELKTVFQDYQKTWKGSDKPVETEHEFLLPMGIYKGQTILFHGLIDEIYEDNVMGEHKTFGQMPNMGTLAMNVQTCLYSKALEIETGHKSPRVQWDYIKSAMASYPVWLDKSNRFSDAKNNSITHLSWLRACAERGITDPNVLARAEGYRQNISNFFFRTTTELLPVMVDSVWDDFQMAVKDLVKREETNKMKNVSRDCGYCSFRPICYAEFTGADVEQVIETDFIQKPPPEWETYVPKKKGVGYDLIRESDLPF